MDNHSHQYLHLSKVCMYHIFCVINIWIDNQYWFSDNADLDSSDCIDIDAVLFNSNLCDDPNPDFFSDPEFLSDKRQQPSLFEVSHI